MLSILLGVVLAVVAAVVLVAAYASTRPDTFTVERSRLIDAPADRIQPLIANLEAMNTWNPFAQDPTIVGTYSGPARGAGARYDFESPRACTGHIEVLDERPNHVAMRLVMTKPFACDNRIDFRLAPAAIAPVTLEPVDATIDTEVTRVTWSMSGRNALLPKIVCLVFNMDRTVGGQMESGLASLDARVDRHAAAKAA